MRRLIDRLAVTSQQGECAAESERASLLWAARSPFWAEACQRRNGIDSVTPGHPDSAAIEEGAQLWLNLLDPPTPLFEARTFIVALNFMRRQWIAGASLVICSPDDSRAPTLALLFIAKVLGTLPNGSYDAAWDAFEEAHGPYKPGSGIEEWLREHWHEIPEAKIAYIEGASAEVVEQADPEEAEYLDKVSKLTAKQCIELAKSSALVHFAGFARIVDKDNKLTPIDEQIPVNVFQERALMAFEWLLANNLPIRLVLGPKPRQSGGSTVSAELCIYMTQRFHLSGLVIADETSRTDLLWKMFNEMAERDRLKSFWGGKHEFNSEKAKFSFKEEDGKWRDFQWLRDTANDPKAGAAGTRQIIWFSEAGRYAKEGKVTDQQVIQNAMSSVPEKPGTLVIMESTAEGSNGTFYNTCMGAVTLAERMAGKVGNGWVKVSCWWHEVPDYKLPRTAHNEDWFTALLDARERTGVAKYKWTAEQIAWRRNKIATAFDGNEQLFDQEFPESEDVAFRSSGSPAFNVDGLSRLEIMATVGHSAGRLGAIYENNGNCQFVENPDDAWLWMKELPREGLSYIVFGDFMTGMQSAGSRHRDEHASGVLRAAYTDEYGQPHNTKLVAVLHDERGVRWDNDITSKRVHLISKMYGNAIIAMEVNEAPDILSYLWDKGANLWKRAKEDTLVPGQSLNIPGWKTTHATRPLLVEKMATHIREGTLDVEYKPAVHQFRMFVRLPNGRCEARQGEHDDFVLGMAIGLVCMGAATKLGAAKPARGAWGRGAQPLSMGSNKMLEGKGSAALG